MLAHGLEQVEQSNRVYISVCHNRFRPGGSMLKPGTWLLLFTFTFSIADAASTTPNYWKCNNRIGGTWEFATAPQACDANSFGEDQTLKHRYGVQVLDLSVSRSAERARYMNELYAVIRDAADYYIRRRKPNVSDTERQAFRRAILAVAHQESFFSHYRKSSGAYKLMRGDFGHGHGLMQIDDRFHFVNIDKGYAWDLVGNLRLALEIYYQAWEQAAKASCVSRGSNFQARTRSAYSAYNGGPSQICRWTRASSWAANDLGFFDKWTDRQWERYVSQPNKVSSFNVGCVVDGGESCFGDDSNPTVTAFLGISNEREYACAKSNSKTSCVNSARDLACLSAAGFSVTGLSASKTIAIPSGASLFDRHKLCGAMLSSLAPVGSRIETVKNVYLRETPGGGALEIIQSGADLDVLDFEIRNDAVRSRYYRVIASTGKIGWVFGASDTANSDLIRINDSKGGERIVKLGPALVAMSGGVNLRKTPGGERIVVIPTGTRVTIEDFEIRGRDNEVYVLVRSALGGGWLYAGRILPTMTISEWIKMGVQ